MTLRCAGSVVPVLLTVAAMGAASCGGNSNSSSKLNPSDAGRVADAPVTSAPDGAAGVGGRTSFGGTTGASAGTGGSAVAAAGGGSGSVGSGGAGGAGTGGSSGGTAGSGGSSGGTSGSGGSGSGTTASGGSGRGGSGGSSGGTSGSGGATLSAGGSSAVDAGVGDGSAATPDGAAGRDARGRDVGGGRGGANASGGSTGTGASGGSTGAGGTTSSSTGSDGCTDNQASNLTLQQIAVYQSVKIPIMTDGTEVATASRNSDVVEGRDTMFRMFVTLGSGWTARELSARLTLTPSGGQGTQYYSRQTVSASSTDANLATTFQILVPASAMTDSRYSVEIVECGAQSGTAGTVRFPATGDADLGVKTTGGLKITIVPIQVGTLLPDTSQATLDLYASQMTAMYPIDAISFTVGGTLTATSPVDWTTMLDQVRAKRAQDAPSADTYYFGLVKPASTLRSYCQTSCTSGIGYVVTKVSQASTRAAVGVAFADSPSTLTMAHEVGHNHGRQHSPCSLRGETISGVDPNYPYPNGALGSWGWDSRTQTLFDPSKSTDIMGYCNNQWMSDYTYAGITTRVAAVNGQPAAMVLTLPETLSKWRVLLLDARGPRWGVPIEQEVAPEGEPETATIHGKTGAVLTSVVVYRTEIGDASASMVWVPEPKPDWYAVAVTGASPHPFAAPVTVPRP